MTPQRPTVSSDTSTTALGTLEWEAGVAVDPGDAQNTPMTLKYGAAEGTEVFVGGAPYVRLDAPGPDAEGVGDIVLGMRHRFLEEGSGPSGATQATVKLPVADEDEGLGSGEVDGSLAVIATKGLGAATYTAYYSLDVLGEPGGGAALGHSLALAGGRPVGADLGVFAEVAAVLVPEQDSEQVFTTLGATYAPRDSLVLDTALVVGLSDDAPDLQLVVGFTRNFGRSAPASPETRLR